MNVKCEICGKVFYKRPSHFKRVKHNYCSIKCRGIADRGEGNPMWTDFKICQYCGKKYKGKGKKFCSRKCVGLAQRNRIHTKCAVCGKEIVILHIYKGTPRFCSQKCAGIFHSKRMSRKGNPNWQGGISKKPYSFDFNRELKELIKRRDSYTCQLCDKQEDLVVHHIDYNKQNSNPDNLITLCDGCHGKVHYNRKKWKKELLKILQY